ncbi:MAG: hypothetical protein GVY05_07935 [Bacteroidetes bacterium]|jgi:hypothetical protein|nr:hypothetical protein [Bacteroidota bacterium]
MRQLATILFLVSTIICSAQNGIEDILAAGVEDAQQFSQSYFSPATDAIVYGMSSGWFNTAKSKKFLRFEISAIGNLSFTDSNSQSFQLNTADYNNLSFSTGPNSQSVATALGENNPDIEMIVNVQDPNSNQSVQIPITLPQGIGSEGINFVPTGFIQASIGLIKGFELKARYLPEVNNRDVESQFYGFGLQNELTELIPFDKVLPIRIAALAGYTKYKGKYKFNEDSSIVSGVNRRVESEAESWLFGAIVSTKLPVINFYGSVGYITGDAKTSLLGQYNLDTGINSVDNEVLVDPFSVSSDVSGARATLGFKLKLAFFRLHADYSFQEFNTASVGISLGI